MIHKVIISWDDKDLDEALTWEDFMREYILDEMHGFIDDMDLSDETITHAHGIVDKIMLHLNTYVEPVRHGRWLDLEAFKRPWFRHHIFECSVCRNTLDMDGVNAGRGDANYCPNCGAKMDGERKEE